MYLLYVDASGTPEDQNCSTYVLLGLCVHESAWHDLEAAVASIRARYELSGLPMEFHAKDFCVQIREQEQVADFIELPPQARHDAVRTILERRLAEASTTKERDKRRANLRSWRPFIHLTRAERSRLLTELLDLVGSIDGVRLFAEAVHKSDPRVTDRNHLVRDAFAQIVARFDAFLGRHARNARRERGMLLFDNEPTYQELLHREFLQYRTHGHPWGSVEHVIEQPFFVDSASVSAIQLADTCAYAVRRYIERAGGSHEHELANFNRIFHKFDRAGPRLHGLRHFCLPKSCNCRVCQERGHGG